MSDPVVLLQTLLVHIGQAEPEPWYPSEFAKATDIPRDTLDEPLNLLRMLGLAELTEWVSGRGQGYRLTERGREVAGQPIQLVRLLQQTLAGQYQAFSPPEQDKNTEAPLTTFERGEQIRRALLSNDKPVVCYILFWLMVGIWAFGLVVSVLVGVPLNRYIVGTTNDPLLLLGGLHGLPLLHGEWWRLLSCMFLHIGFIHLLVNGYSLRMLGPLLERLYGGWRFAVLYLLSGLIGSIAAVIVSPDVLSAGASGAIWGLLGGLCAWLYLNRQHLPARLVSQVAQDLTFVILLNVVISLAPGISASAHFGGGLAGVLVGALLVEHRYRRGLARLLCLLTLLVLLPTALGYLRSAMRTDPRWLEMQERLERLQQADRINADRSVTYGHLRSNIDNHLS
jgi:rhomboid protease GluP